MTIFSGKTRISEEEDLWRVIGIHEVTSLAESDRQVIRGYMKSTGTGANIQYDFYQLLDSEPDIYYDLLTNKYKYKKNSTSYPQCTIIEGYLTDGFYKQQITPQNNKIYYDQDKDKYYIYNDPSYREIEKYEYQNTLNTTVDQLYYNNNAFYKNKATISSNIIAILVGDEYEQHPYVKGLLKHNIFYSDKVTFNSDYIYYNNNDDVYYLYDSEEEILIPALESYDIINPPEANSNQVVCINVQEDIIDTRTLVTGYKISDDRFYETVSAGYTNPIIPTGEADTTYVYYDQLTNTYYFLYADGFRAMPVYEAYEEHSTHNQVGTAGNLVLYYHNYENENVLHHREIIKGYFVNENFYTTKVSGDPTAIYHTPEANRFYTYNSEDNLFNSYSFTNPYEIGVLYSNKVTPSTNNFYKDENNNIYYYDGDYHVTEILDGYYIPIKNIMCSNKVTGFTENNKNLYYNLIDNKYYVYKNADHTLVKINPVSCYIISNVPYKKQRAALGAIYYDINDSEYYIYDNGTFREYNHNSAISNASQIVLSLTKQDMLIDDNILDQNPYDEDVILTGADTTHAGLLTADLYNRFIDLESRYKMRISSTPYATLADLNSAAPTDENMIYIVGNKEQYVLSDDGSYIKIGDTDLSTLDLTDIASVDDISDILEQIRKQDLNLQNQITTLNNELALKYPTANIITNVQHINNQAYQNEAVSSKVLVDYVQNLLSNVVSVDHLVTETVVERVEKHEDSIRVYYKDIVTAMPLDYIDDSLNSNNVGVNRAYSSRLMKTIINDLQAQINNIVDTGIVFEWASGDTSNATIVISINNRVV